MSRYNVFWFRRDLRIHDNHALYQALRDFYPLRCIFIYDSNILQGLEKDDPRVLFITQELQRINDELKAYGSGLSIHYGNPLDVFIGLLKDPFMGNLYANRDYEPYAIERDHRIGEKLQSHHRVFNVYDDQVIMPPESVLKPDREPYNVFTPYSKKWLSSFSEMEKVHYPSEHNLSKLDRAGAWISKAEAGYHQSGTGLIFPPRSADWPKLRDYHQNRDFPAREGTSRLGIHLRFGTISIRGLAYEAFEQSHVFLNELIWREFYMMILFHYPHVVTQSFRKEYDRIRWVNNQKDFESWCSGQTGYPIVDAGMRELNESGYMHNRVRMITASFLTKHLLIDWRWGEAYFAQKLLDYDLAANNGGWQWAAGTGCDAAPYFRVFNPSLQQQRFDPSLEYIRKWVPEISSPFYSKPIVEHSFARNRALETYKTALTGV